ncbi:MAG: DNA polymerase III subunit gamma/tau [Pseudomonadota bacterium]|nr:DNA polymerase III subunit gamma/tau [Gammaproteobacteria bacterium]MDQ3581255.1 DNA polymerase III subunit gamma/tau [Pseudomonadota bacterium]
MAYQVLARKWRPRSFAEMVGQTPVLRALQNALDRQHLHHAYLFTGTRGVGKTTVARVFAKALNCEAGVSATPCGQCASCVEIDEGRFMDLIEVDAASRTRVDETRELLDNVQYAPTRGRFKVYLIDEVHMFSNHSFNALLKTLEEPPPHVKFLLATTEPRRIPVTILSRCLAFDLKRIGTDLIAARLTHILSAEGIASEPAATFTIALAADGSMRDALSLLDQSIAHGSGQLCEADVRAMLGRAGAGQALALVQRLAAGDAEGLLEVIEATVDYAPDYEAVLGEVLDILHRVAVCQVLGRPVAETSGADTDIAALADTLAAEDGQLFYQIALIGRRDLALAPDPRRGFEMVMLRMLAFQRETARDESIARPPVTQTSGAAARAPVEARRREALPRPTDSAPVETATARASAVSEARGWHLLIDALGLTGLCRELAMHCAPSGEWRPGEVFRLSLPAGLAHLRSAKLEARLEGALRRHHGDAGLRLGIAAEGSGPVAATSPAVLRVQDAEARQEEARRAIAQDPHVQALCDDFGAHLDPATVRPR